MATYPALTNQTAGLTQIGSSDSLQIGAGVSSSASTLILNVNGTNKVTLGSSAVTLSDSTATYTLSQSDNTANSATAATFTIQAQNATGTTSTGGALTLTSGTGTTVAGNIILATGGATKLTVAPTLLTSVNSINISSDTAYLSIGGTPATVGSIRIDRIAVSSNTNIISLRNNGNTADMRVIGADTSDDIIFGDTSNAVAAYYDVKTSGTHNFRVNSTAAFTISATSYTANVATLQFTTGQSSVTINQADNTTNSATAATLTLQAQNATGTTATGGALSLTSGTGTTVAGNINLQTGGTARLVISPTTLTWSVPTLTFDNAQSSPLLKQNSKTSDATTNTITIQSQSAFASASTNVNGGFAHIQGGAATSNGTTGLRGGVRLQVGADTSETMVEVTEVAVGQRVVALAQLGAGISSTQVPSSGGDGVIWISNAATAPTAAPVGGSVVFAQSGALKAIGTSGTITTMATADPHCPVCGTDYMKEFENPSYGYLAICMYCLANELGPKNWILRTK